MFKKIIPIKKGINHQTRFYSLEEVAHILDVHTSTLRRWCIAWNNLKEKPKGIILPPIKQIGKKQARVFDRGDIESLKSFKRWLNDNHYNTDDKEVILCPWKYKGNRKADK